MTTNIQRQCLGNEFLTWTPGQEFYPIVRPKIHAELNPPAVDMAISELTRNLIVPELKDNYKTQSGFTLLPSVHGYDGCMLRQR